MITEHICQTCNNGICQRRCAPRAVTIVSHCYLGRPVNGTETDLLLGNEFSQLKIGTSIFNAPDTGWTHDLIERYVIAYENRPDLSMEAWDIYIGSHWVGSSEV
ncbi:hypothetical protein [Vibrio harveyi]|uniref:hypothetical protein n=1 Tax=Vibrio harveyi TaxID=669 RepID=UPI002480E2B3|nr:hypothetical protein [Vibrio harveyi]